jgi:hypothetical protein
MSRDVISLTISRNYQQQLAPRRREGGDRPPLKTHSFKERCDKKTDVTAAVSCALRGKDEDGHSRGLTRGSFEVTENILKYCGESIGRQFI